MTRANMKERIAQLLGLGLGDSVAGDPFALDNIINRVTDEFAGPGLDCYWVSVTADLTTNEPEYCSSVIYKVLGAYWLDANSEWQILSPTTPQALDRMYGSSWRNADGQAQLQWIAYEGANNYKLYPMPNFTRTGGIKFEGYANTNSSGLSTWLADTTECPLPTWCHEAIVLGSALDVCMMLLTTDNPVEAKRAQFVMPSLESRYRALRGKAERASCEYFDKHLQPTTAAWRGLY